MEVPYFSSPDGVYFFSNQQRLPDNTGASYFFHLRGQYRHHKRLHHTYYTYNTKAIAQNRGSKSVSGFASTSAFVPFIVRTIIETLVVKFLTKRPGTVITKLARLVNCFAASAFDAYSSARCELTISLADRFF